MISVIIPAFNEEESIYSTISKINETLSDTDFKPFEIIVVNDGSTDNTKALALEAGALVVNNAHNVGYGKSLKNGIKKASYDTIVITDADGTYPINKIPTLVKEYQNGYDMIVGARKVKFYKESIIKAPLRKILKKIVELTAGRDIPDINSGLRVFSRTTSMTYFNHLCDTFSFTTSITLAYMMNSKFVKYIDIEYYERLGDTKVRLFRDSIRTLQYIIEAATFYNPLKIFSLFSIVCLLVAFISISLGIIFQLISLFTLGVGAILLAIMMLGLGLLAVLLKQIMQENGS